MLSMSRGAGRLLLVALLAIGVLICAASSAITQTAAAAARVPVRLPRTVWPRPPRHPHHLSLRAHARLLSREVVRAALRQRGVAYHYGGGSPASGFDCSGLVAWSFSQIGVELPHSSYLLAAEGRPVRLGALLPGDILVFDGRGHVGIYIGHGRFVHAPHSGTTVTVDSLDSANGAGLELARRLIPHQ
jgi:cell wall-associated NlpC family hydrolase